MPSEAIPRPNVQVRRRRVWQGAMWVGLAALTAVMVCIAAGVFDVRVAPDGTPDTFVPRRVDMTQGWGEPKGYTGRYEARTPSASGDGEREGNLTLFLRSEHPGDPLLPSGMLSLHSKAGNLVGYVTDLRSGGGRVTAKIRGGAFEGPVIGTLTGSQPKHGTFRATIQAPGADRVEVDYVKIGEAPDFAQAQDTLGDNG
jgi:hypothetical protein